MQLNILIIVDPFIKVPPKYYGGIERVVADLAEGLQLLGHEVTLWASPSSRVTCKLDPFGKEGEWSKWSNFRNILKLNIRLLFKYKNFDIIHNFGRLAYLFPILQFKIPKIISYQRVITHRSVKIAKLLSGNTLHFVGCSQSLITRYNDDQNFHYIYNAVQIDKYNFIQSLDNDAPLIFLGRIEKIKGPHLAIVAARKSKRKLIIAGNIPDNAQHKEFFHEYIEPYIDNDSIKYLGPVDDKQKNELLGSSAALLMPILWDEPFGIVMIEALACGTPIIGFNRGSIPEVIEHGVNGYICENVDEIVTYIQQIKNINREDCRLIMERKFSDQAVLNEYLKIYSQLIMN